MNEKQETILIGSGLIALAILAGSFVISHKLSKALDDKNFWAGSNIPTVANDVHSITGPLAQIGETITQWTRA